LVQDSPLTECSCWVLRTYYGNARMGEVTQTAGWLAKKWRNGQKHKNATDDNTTHMESPDNTSNNQDPLMGE